MTNNNEPIDVAWLISLITAALGEAKRTSDKIARGTGGREISLCITKLEEARHRAVDAMMLLQSANEPTNNQQEQEA